jgi:hypothetical protein
MGSDLRVNSPILPRSPLPDQNEHEVVRGELRLKLDEVSLRLVSTGYHGLGLDSKQLTGPGGRLPICTGLEAGEVIVFVAVEPSKFARVGILC